jgi:hypothetical protein
MIQVSADRAIVRQGGTVQLTVNGTGLGDADNIVLGSLKLTRPSDAKPNSFRLAVTIPSGTPPGPLGLTFTTQGGRKMLGQAGVVTVSPITVALNGDDKQNDGASDRPFGTIARALQVAGPGDTLHLDAGVHGDNSDPYVRYYLPPKATLEGDSSSTTLLSGQIVIAADGVIQHLALDSLVQISGKGSTVKVTDVQASGDGAGFDVSPFASGATLVISGKTSVSSAATKPVRWEADDGSLQVIEGSVLSSLDEKDGEAIRMEGNRVQVKIDSAQINSRGANAVAMIGQANVLITNTLFQGILDLMGPDTTGTVSNSTFQISSATSAIGGIYFFGDSLSVTDSIFNVVGLFENNFSSMIVVRGCIFSGYREPAVLLQRGTMDLGTMTDPGHNQFMPGEFVTENPPVALRVVAETGMASASFSATTVDGDSPPLGHVMGPATAAPYYSIEQMVPINFY